MDQSQSWTFSDPQLQGIVKNLHVNGQRYIPIVVSGNQLLIQSNQFADTSVVCLLRSSLCY